MIKTVIYTRVSSTGQDYESQITDLTRYATNNNFEVVSIFSEKVSGYDQSKDRIEYENMKSFVFKNNIKHILMWEISRLARNTIKSLKEIEDYTSKGVNIYFKKENINTLSDDFSSKLLITIMTTMAEMERGTTIERISRGSLASVSKGKITGFQTLPYGYKRDKNGFLAIDDDEAEVVKKVFDLADNLISQRKIADILNSLDIKTRWTKLGRINVNRLNKVVPIKWKPNSIGVILRNKLYKGERHYKGYMFPAPRIIDIDLWERVQSKLIKKIGYTTKPTKYTYLLKGKLNCSECGRLYGTRTETRYNKEVSFYSCNGAKDIEIKCKNGQYATAVIDKAVFDAMITYKEFHKTITNDLESKSTFNIEVIQTQIDYYKNEVTELNKRELRIINLFKDGIINKKTMTSDLGSIALKKSEYSFNIKTLTKDIKNFKKTDELIEDRIYEWFNSDNRQEFMDKYLQKVMFKKIDKETFDSEGLVFSEIETGGVIRNPKFAGNDKIAYLEIYAYNSSEPIRCYISNVSKLISEIL